MVRTALKRCRTRHQRVSARRNSKWSGVGGNTAIDLKPDVAASLVDHFADGFYLAQLAGNKALPTKTRVHAHDQNEINVIDQVIQHLCWRMRIKHNARHFAK